MSEDTPHMTPRRISLPQSGLDQGVFYEDSPSEAKGGGGDRFSVAAAMDVLHAPTRRRYEILVGDEGVLNPSSEWASACPSR